mgnify:CR=1 FL=1
MSNPLLQTQDLCKTYRLGRVNVPVLKGCSMHVNSGEFLAVLGSSGSGKSTLINALNGAYRGGVGGERIAYTAKAKGKTF